MSRRNGAMTWSRLAARGVLTAVLALYTVYAVGPMLWLAAMSLRTTSEINLDHYALPRELHWWKFARAWFNSSYDTYFWNSVVVVGAAVIVVTVIGATAAFCLARYRFPGNRLIFLAMFSTILLPPQITIISLFQTHGGIPPRELADRADPRLCRRAAAAHHLSARGIFRPHPAGSVRRGADRRLWRLRNFLADRVPDRHAGGRHDGDPQFHPAVERVPLRRRADRRR